MRPVPVLIDCLIVSLNVKRAVHIFMMRTIVYRDVGVDRTSFRDGPAKCGRQALEMDLKVGTASFRDGPENYGQTFNKVKRKVEDKLQETTGKRLGKFWDTSG